MTLKPCPFCGETARRQPEHRPHTPGLMLAMGPFIGCVTCTTCGAEGPASTALHPTEAEAIELWNRRHVLAPITEASFTLDTTSDA